MSINPLHGNAVLDFQRDSGVSLDEDGEIPEWARINTRIVLSEEQWEFFVGLLGPPDDEPFNEPHTD